MNRSLAINGTLEEEAWQKIIQEKSLEIENLPGFRNPKSANLQQKDMHKVNANR